MLCAVQAVCAEQPMSAGLHRVRQRQWRQQRALSVPQRSPGGAEHHQYQVCGVFSITHHFYGATI